MSTIASKLTAFHSSYSDRRFSLVGSAIDKSVIGAVDKSKGIWEPHVMNLMAQLISPSAVCLDIGANVGIYTLVMSDLARTGRVFAFEPASMNFGFLQRNIADNYVLNVTSHRVALGNKFGSGYFHYLPDFAGCSFAQDETVSADPDAIIQAAWGTRFARITEAVEYTTLDLWAAQESLERLDFIKMDDCFRTLPPNTVY
jgi:FkbM family methyltransferase